MIQEKERKDRAEKCKIRYALLRIAFVLDGKGSAKAFAKDCQSTPHQISHVISGRPCREGHAPRTSFRLEKLADQYIDRMFSANIHIVRKGYGNVI